jgi:hypothetical protein
MFIFIVLYLRSRHYFNASVTCGIIVHTEIDGINIWVYLAALAIIGICLFIGQTMVKKRLRRKENENAN